MSPRPSPANSLLPRFCSLTSLSRLPVNPFAQVARVNFLPVTTITPQPLRTSTYILRRLSGTRSLKMASDEDYMAFLNKANQDTGSVSAQSSAKVALKAKDAGVDVPKGISAVCQQAVYVSDADEPFEVVSLKWDHGLPTESQFASLTNHPSPSDAKITIMDPLEWDSKGQYDDVVKAVRLATAGNDVRVYRVVRDATRTEYWVLSSMEGKLVGAKALAIES